MFIYSIRASTLRLFGIILLGLVLTLGVILSVGGERTVAVGSNTEIDYSGIKTREDRIAFMEKYGVRVDEASESEEKFRMPADFDRVILGYNELQKRQGLDLSKYKGKSVTVYSYPISENRVVHLIVYKNKIIGGDIADININGEIKPLKR